MFSTTIAAPSATIANPASFSPADAAATLLAARGWHANAVQYRGGYGTPWSVEVRNAAGHRVGEGDGDTEREALQAALADALRREEGR